MYIPVLWVTERLGVLECVALFGATLPHCAVAVGPSAAWVVGLEFTCCVEVGTSG